MTVQPDIDGEATKVRLSLQQFWTLLAAVAIGTGTIMGALYAIKSDQAELRRDVRDGLRDLAELRTSRNESLKDWNQWRQQKDQTDSEQNYQIRQLHDHNPLR